MCGFISGRYNHQIALAAVVTLGPLATGLTAGFTSPAVPQLVKQGRLHGDLEISWFGAIINIGAMFGGVLSGLTVERCGRKASNLFSSLPMAIGWLLQTAAPSALLLCAGRFLCGVGMGFVVTSFFIYVSETASKGIRGTLAMGFQIGSTSGILLSYTLGLALSPQWLATISAVPSTVMAVFILFVPPSPRFLLKQHRETEARDALIWLRKSQGPEIEDELNEIKAVVRNTEQSTVGFREFLHKPFRAPLALGLSLVILQQLCGINAVIFYTQTIIEKSGWQSKPGVPAVVVAALKVGITMVATSLIDLAGRRRLFILSGVLLTISLVLLGVFFFMIENQQDPAYVPYMLIASLILYEVGYAIGWGPVPWIVLSEIFPLCARGKAQSYATFVSNVFSFVVTLSFLPLQAVILSYGIFWVFAGICFIGTLIGIIFLPENTGKSLEDIESVILTKQ